MTNDKTSDATTATGATATRVATASQKIYEFRKQIAALKEFRGRGTELISVYITPGYSISDIAGKLRDEQGQASNIKSKSTRMNVVNALEKILQYLKTFKKTPENGIAIFCGNVSKTEGKTDIQLYSIIPPQPLHVQFYRCESTFVLEPLEEMLETTGSYGLVVIDGSDAAVGILRGKNLKVLKEVHNLAPSKVHKGGQSAARYGRIREEAYEDYFKRVGEAMNAFLEQKNFKGVIVGGPGPVKENFLKQKTFNYQLKILGVVDTGYSGEYGLKEVLEKAQEFISQQEAVRERQLVIDFIKRITTGGLAVYGYEDTKRVLESKQAERLLLSEELKTKQKIFECEKCGKRVEKIEENEEQSSEKLEEACECGGKLKLISEKDIGKELIQIAESQEIPIEFISRETREGLQFYGTFKGIGAFLRYK